MPLARYFLFVGGTLLALLFVFDAYLPSPVVARAPAETVDRPVVRIHSAQKLPERIVIDTSIATIVPPPVVVAEVTAKPQQPQKPQVLDALAQATPSDIKKSDLKKPEPALPPKHKVARRQVHQPMVASAQQPRFAFAQGPRFDFDFFGRN
jgi:hypothetical protein